MPGNNLDETWKKKEKKKKEKKKKVGVEAMTVVAEVMVVMRHQWVEECQHRAETLLAKLNRRNTQAMMQ